MYKTDRCKSERAYYRTHLKVSNAHALAILEHMKKSSWIKNIETIITEHNTDIYFLAEQNTIDCLNSWLFSCAKDGDYWR